MKALHVIGFILVIVGGLNWGLVGIGELFGLGNWNVVNLVLGSWPTLEALVYIVIGVFAAIGIFLHKGTCKMCVSDSKPMM